MRVLVLSHRDVLAALEDLAAAQCAVATATQQGIGTEVEL